MDQFTWPLIRYEYVFPYLLCTPGFSLLWVNCSKTIGLSLSTTTLSRDFHPKSFSILCPYILLGSVRMDRCAGQLVHLVRSYDGRVFNGLFTFLELSWNNRSLRARLPYFTVKAQGLMMFSVRSICRRSFSCGISRYHMYQCS